MVARKSVNIPNREREQIMTKARELFMKTAMSRHPDKTFIEKLTKRIYLDNLERIRPLLDNGLIKYIPHLEKSSLEYSLRNMKLPEGYYIKTLSESTFNKSELISEQSSLVGVPYTEINIPPEFFAGNKIPFTSEPYSEGNSNYSTTELSESTKELITEFNTKMDETYQDLGTQLDVLMKTIASCRTTKAFETHLPNLVNLYPKSILRKIEEKNNEDVEMTEDENNLTNAMTTIATASLLGDD